MIQQSTRVPGSPTFRAFCFLLVLGGLIGKVAAKESNEIGDASVAQLIDQLGASRFSDREQASKQLLAYGLDVYGALQDVQDHSDRETRLRVRELLSELVLIDRQQKIKAFVATNDLPSPDELPGWDSFRKVAGDSMASRQLMGEMLKNNWDMLAKAEADPGEAGTLLIQRCEELHQALSIRRESIGSADVAALLLLAIHPETGAYRSTQQQIYNFCYRIRVEPAPHRDLPETDPLRKLLGAWVARPVDVANTAFYSLNIALRYSLPEGLTPAVQILKENNSAPYIRQYAILTVARFKDMSSRQRLEEMLADQSVCYTQKDPRSKKVAFESQIRDVALAILIHLDGKNPADFGFERMRKSTSMVYQPNTLGFTSAEKRQLAFDAFARLRSDAGQPLPALDRPAERRDAQVVNPHS